METTDLRARLADILAKEEADQVDWSVIEHLCLDLANDLNRTGDDYPEAVAHYLCDSDIRSRDPKYAEGQREAVKRFVATGEYDDGVVVPGWGCLAVIGLIGAGILWLLL